MISVATDIIQVPWTGPALTCTALRKAGRERMIRRSNELATGSGPPVKEAGSQAEILKGFEIVTPGMGRVGCPEFKGDDSSWIRLVWQV